MFDPDATYGRIVSYAAFLIRYLVVLAAAGALAMAIVELAKTVFDWRTRFHAREVAQWFVPRVKPSRANGYTKPAPPQERLQAFAELLQLCSGVDLERARAAARRLVTHGGLQGVWLPPVAEHAPFAQDTEVMIAHFQDAIDMAIDTPLRYRELFVFITSGAGADDVKAWLERADAGGIPAASAQRPELFARLHQAAKRRLDAFALFTASRWVNRQQFAANILGALVLYVALVSTEGGWLAALPFSVLGGVLAPVAKDIVVALQQVRQK